MSPWPRTAQRPAPTTYSNHPNLLPQGYSPQESRAASGAWGEASPMREAIPSLRSSPASGLFVNRAHGDQVGTGNSPRPSSARATRGNRWHVARQEGARSGHSALVRSGRAARRPQLVTRGLGRAAADAAAQRLKQSSHCFPTPPSPPSSKYRRRQVLAPARRVCRCRCRDAQNLFDEMLTTCFACFCVAII